VWAFAGRSEYTVHLGRAECVNSPLCFSCIVELAVTSSGGSLDPMILMFVQMNYEILTFDAKIYLKLQASLFLSQAWKCLHSAFQE
jgi:hypothetical protein